MELSYNVSFLIGDYMLSFYFLLSVEMWTKFSLRCQQNSLALALYTLPLPLKYDLGKILASSQTTFLKLIAGCCYGPFI